VTTETTDTTDATDAAIAATLELDDDERELVTLDLDALLPTLDADRRARYAHCAKRSWPGRSQVIWCRRWSRCWS
jgi:hypothetical protein